MGLDIGIKTEEKTHYKVSFEDDGYYWFLHPLFEKMASSIGFYIDLYGSAQLKDANIAQFELLLKEAYAMVSEKTDYWEVHTGTETYPIKKEIYNKISKLHLINKLDILSSMASEVKKGNSKMVFEGD